MSGNELKSIDEPKGKHEKNWRNKTDIRDTEYFIKQTKSRQAGNMKHTERHEAANMKRRYT